jgi:hypothetical protein
MCQVGQTDRAVPGRKDDETQTEKGATPQTVKESESIPMGASTPSGPLSRLSSGTSVPKTKFPQDPRLAYAIADGVHRRMVDFSYHWGNGGKLKKISPASIRPIP